MTVKGGSAALIAVFNFHNGGKIRNLFVIKVCDILDMERGEYMRIPSKQSCDKNRRDFAGGGGLIRLDIVSIKKISVNFKINANVP